MTRFWITLDQGVDFVLDCLKRMEGGEIFVPKIPSMKMVDLARAMKPGIDIEVIGIRPGEKLHEVMIPGDEARNTLEYPTLYVIQPPLSWWDANAFVDKRGGERVDDEFEYSSKNNKHWLTNDELLKMIKDCEY